MKKGLAKMYCWLFKHDMVSLFSIDNGRSKYGTFKCLRCDKEEHWQYDY